MLRRNLIAIVIVTLGLVMASNAFGQRGGTEKRPDKNNPDFNKNEHAIKPIHAEVNEVMIDGMKVYGNEVTLSGGRFGNSETSRTSKSNKQDKLGNFEIQDLKTPKQIQPGQNSGGTISNQRTKSNSQNKLGNFEIQDIKSPRDVATGQVMNKNCQEFEAVRPNKSSNIQSPRDVASGQATGKRQHLPIKGYNLGDTATHERKRGKN